jgi:hypothetical protein
VSVCIRCGKERIVVSSRKEVVSKSEVVYTTTVCPDPECQKIVEKGLRDEERKRVALKDEQEKRELQRLAARKVAG